MTHAVTKLPTASADELVERVVIQGDLSKLTAEQRVEYYRAVCNSVGLNWLTKPFEYITLNGRLTLYALRNCTDQLRQIHGISVVEMMETERDGIIVVTCKVRSADGRTDIAKGAVNLANLKGEALANAVMKAETKAKRRATLSICGLSLLDETEVADIPASAKRENPHVTRPSDVVDVPALDDPDRMPEGTDAEIKPLLKKDARPRFEAMQKEMHAIKDADELIEWGKTAGDRIQLFSKDWQEMFRGLFKEHLIALRAAQSPVAADQEGEASGDASPFDPAQWLADLDGAYSGCEDAASFFEVDKKLFLSTITQVATDIRAKAQAIRNTHFARVNENEDGDA